VVDEEQKGFGAHRCSSLRLALIGSGAGLTTALTLHRHGITDVETSKQAAEALRPLAGSFAAGLYTVGVIGVGLLSIPTLAGSAAYALAETFAWKQGLNEKPKAAWRFYAVFVLSMAAGMALYFFNVNPVKAMYWSAIINGILDPCALPVDSNRNRCFGRQAHEKAAKFNGCTNLRGSHGLAYVCGGGRNVLILDPCPRIFQAWRGRLWLSPEYLLPVVHS
jgi:hypothetical protein